jgi:uncharacterized protein YkwD
MIKKGKLSHDYVYDRQSNLKQIYKATRVGEILAYNYQSNQLVLQAWINSPSHLSTLTKSEYTNFGVSITTDSITNKKFFTFIFIKK